MKNFQKAICGGNDTYLRRKLQGVGGVKVFRRRLYLSSQIKSHRRSKKGKIVPRPTSWNFLVILGTYQVLHTTCGIDHRMNAAMPEKTKIWVEIKSAVPFINKSVLILKSSMSS